MPKLMSIIRSCRTIDQLNTAAACLSAAYNSKMIDDIDRVVLRGEMHDQYFKIRGGTYDPAIGS